MLVPVCPAYPSVTSRREVAKRRTSPGPRPTTSGLRSERAGVGASWDAAGRVSTAPIRMERCNERCRAAAAKGNSVPGRGRTRCERAGQRRRSGGQPGDQCAGSAVGRMAGETPAQGEDAGREGGGDGGAGRLASAPRRGGPRGGG